MENPPVEDVLPIEHGEFSNVMLVFRGVTFPRGKRGIWGGGPFRFLYEHPLEMEAADFAGCLWKITKKKKEKPKKIDEKDNSWKMDLERTYLFYITWEIVIFWKFLCISSH